MNNIINENKKNTELIRNDISKLYEQMNKQFKELKNCNILTNQEINYNFDHNNESIKRVKYIGQILNGVPEGKGIMYWNNGDIYEGDWKNDKREGKGIMFKKNGDIYEGEWKNGLYEGKGIMYWSDGDKYEGYFKNGLFDGKGIYYYNNGNRYEGDYKNGNQE